MRRHPSNSIDPAVPCASGAHSGPAAPRARRLAAAVLASCIWSPALANAPQDSRPPPDAASTLPQNEPAHSAGSPTRHATAATLDRRIELLARELDLTPEQQASVRRLLERQRDQVMKVWNDPTLPSAERIGATRAIGDRTADGIRALLTEEQRRRYFQPRHPRPADADPTVDQWLAGSRR